MLSHIYIHIHIQYSGMHNPPSFKEALLYLHFLEAMNLITTFSGRACRYHRRSLDSS